MKSTKSIAKIINIKKLNYSIYGNPKFEIDYIDGDERATAKTATNAPCGYLFGYYSIGRQYEITHHTTKNGNIIIDYAKEI